MGYRIDIEKGMTLRMLIRRLNAAFGGECMDTPIEEIEAYHKNCGDGDPCDVVHISIRYGNGIRLGFYSE